MPGKDEKKEQEQEQKQEQNQQQQEQNQQEQEQKQQQQEQKQEQKQKLNDFYFSMMEFADNCIKDSRTGLSDLINPETNALYKNATLKQVAKAMAYAQIAMKYGKGPEPDYDTQDNLKEQAKTDAEKIFNSLNFQATFKGMKNSEILKMVSDPQKGKNFGNPISYEEFSKRLQEREKSRAAEIKENAARIEQQERLGGLVNDLENSTSKSFTGKLKSIFVGNSKQYKAALKAMKDLAGGTVKYAVDKTKAKQAIVDYILVRGGKERDHQYGRDRFDAFMKGLGEVMTPYEFLQCCREVNKRREATYGNTSYNIKPYNYLQGEQLDTFKEEEAKILDAEKKALHKRNSTAKLRDEEQEKAHATNERRAKIEELTKNEKDRASDDAKKIRKDALSIASGEKPSSNKTIPERDQDYLNMIRRAANLLKDPNAQMNIDGLRKQIADRSEKHPAFRLVAQKLIRDKGLTDKFGYQETFTRKMDEDTLKGLEKQVKDLQEQDQKLHPDDPIKDVKVRDRGLKELQKLEEIQKAEDLENKRLEEQADKTKKTTEKQGGDMVL